MDIPTTQLFIDDDMRKAHEEAVAIVKREQEASAETKATHKKNLLRWLTKR